MNRPSPVWAPSTTKTPRTGTSIRRSPLRVAPRLRLGFLTVSDHSRKDDRRYVADAPGVVARHVVGGFGEPRIVGEHGVIEVDELHAVQVAVRCEWTGPICGPVRPLIPFGAGPRVTHRGHQQFAGPDPARGLRAAIRE